MRVALIPPIEHLGITHETDLQLLLPQLLGDPGYRAVYENHLSNPNQYVIMDNGAAEEEQLGDDELVAVADDLFPQELAIPDVLADGVSTIDRALAFLDQYGEYFQYETPTKLGLVTQGVNEAEAIITVRAVLKHPHADAIKTLYIPRLLVDKTHEPYVRIRTAIALSGHDRDIHLFGVSNWFPGEVRLARNYDVIRSIDTSLPFTAAFTYSTLPSLTRGPGRPERYFDNVMDRIQEACAIQNVQTFKEWANA